jgi:hypothetical protein
MLIIGSILLSQIFWRKNDKVLAKILAAEVRPSVCKQTKALVTLFS